MITLNILNLLHDCQNGDVSCMRAHKIIEEYIEKSIKEKSCEDRMVVIPVEPTTELLISMAMRQDHSFCFDSELTDAEILEHRNSESYAVNFTARQWKTTAEKAMVLSTMKKLHDEVVGSGFYKHKYEN